VLIELIQLRAASAAVVLASQEPHCWLGRESAALPFGRDRLQEKEVFTQNRFVHSGARTNGVLQLG
jgi:hypothetical protein